MKLHKYFFAPIVLLAFALLQTSRTVVAAPSGFVYLLGGDDDKVYQFSQDIVGQLSRMKPASVDAGKGMMSAALTPTGAFLYTTGDLPNAISEFRIDANGHLDPLPGGTFETPLAEILSVSPNGKYLYSIDTNADQIFAFQIGVDGHLKRLPYVASTEKLPLNMTFDSAGHFAYVICGCGSNPESGSNTIDQFRVNKNGSLSPLRPWIVDAGYWGRQLFASTTKPYIYLPDRDGLTEYRVSVTGQLVDPISTRPATSFSQVFGVFDEELGCVVSTATQEDGTTAFPDELVVTKVANGKALEVGQMYMPDDTGTLEEGLGSERGKNAALASLVLDLRKHIVYAIDAQSFKIFRYRVNPDATLTQLLPSVITDHDSQPPNPPHFYLPYAYPNGWRNYLLFVPKK
jgi:DNA-binding beta-propeller fold protein YncE